MSNTHYVPPAAMDRRFNSITRWLVDHGVNLAGAQTLTVVGRTSGIPQRTPVNPLTIDGREFLVSPRGETQWVRNARVADTVTLRRGRRHRTARLVEIESDQRAAIIRTYLDRWGWEVKRFLPDDLPVDADLATVAVHAHLIPVFEVAPAS